MGEIEAVEPTLAAQPLGHAPEDLRGDHARVAPRAHERPETDRGRDPISRLPSDGLCLLERRVDRCNHVRAGVTVRDGEHVERINVVAVHLEVRDSRTKRRQKASAVARSPNHRLLTLAGAVRHRSGPTLKERWGSRSTSCPDTESMVLTSMWLGGGICTVLGGADLASPRDML